MVHEEPPDQIVLVPQPTRLHPVRAQEEPRVLDPPGRQHVASGAGSEAVAGKGCHVDSSDVSPRRVRLDVDDVRPEVESDVRSGSDLGAVGLPESRRRAEVEGLRREAPVVTLGEGRKCPDLRALALVVGWLNLADREGSPIVRLELRSRERPAAMRNPRPFLSRSRRRTHCRPSASSSRQLTKTRAEQALPVIVDERAATLPVVEQLSAGGGLGGRLEEADRDPRR
jgi:hypothetical protein